MRFSFKHILVAFLGIFALALLVLPQPTIAQAPTEWSVSAPSGQLQVKVQNQQRVSYQIWENGVKLLDSAPVGITGSQTNLQFTDNLTFVSQAINTIDETYTLPVGKTSSYHNQANELVLTFSNSSGQRVAISFRAYDDGVAYRYQFPGSTSYSINSELSSFNLTGATKVWAQNWINNYEDYYNQTTVAGLTTGSFGFPMLAEMPGNKWVLLSEAGVYGTYTASHLVPAGQSGMVKVDFAGGESLPVEGSTTLVSPWRVILAGDLATVIESTLVTDLNPPNELSAATWLRPGRIAWSWWSNHASPQSLATQKAYVDFAATMGWEYILVDEGWSESWVPELVSYANSKNVKVILWFFYGGFTQWTPTGWLPSLTNARTQMQKLRNWGVAGAKIDFFDSDTQNTMQIYDTIMQAAKENELAVNLHGSTIPRGEQRRWPHLLTREGVKGSEHMTQTPAHNLTLPFTRNVLGSMDYTPVTFSVLGPTTYAHQLAQAVVYESAWQHFADSKETYAAIPAAVDLLKIIPTTWDETELIAGYPGDYIALARRKGNDWYIGVMNTTARQLAIPLSFFTGGSFTATLFTDNDTTNQVTKSTQSVTSNQTLAVNLRANSGAVIHLQNTGTASCPTDINLDGVTDQDDKTLLENSFFIVDVQANRADINADGVIDLTDYSLLARNYSQICSTI